MTMPQQLDDEPVEKRVHFSVVEEFEYEVEEFTEEELELLWYTMDDMVALVKRELKLNEKESKKESHSWRGLEHMQSGVDDRSERVQQICDAILDAYDELCEDSDAKESDKAEALRAECRALTREDRKRAYKFGLRDQAVAETICKDKADTANKRKSKDKKERSSKSSSSSSSSSKETRRNKRVRSKEMKSPVLPKKSPTASDPVEPPAQVLRMNPIAA